MIAEIDRELLETMQAIRSAASAAQAGGNHGKCRTCTERPARGGGECLGCLQQRLADQLRDAGAPNPGQRAVQFIMAAEQVSQAFQAIERELAG